ncbi:Na+/H+ antiporter NhaA [Limnovirga soli]|uniref:Na(+)/H(+) antiporter NhaA n=1 Tax=Limnovirga soli TaxID=2656915 RepID=A0A8J8FF30_9BACT|nr:Na+/H+ antiporter NhaA [Limnovirga soli]NNV56743.1 Na+/H+ antiporter NhaA [Limnovirga soli]
MTKQFHKIKNVHHHFLTPIRAFLQDSRAVGVILIFCTALSLFLANTASTQASYTNFFQIKLFINSGKLNFPDTPLSWINDIFMTLFFLLVAMEIKRELTIGELASIKKSLLPVLAAVGGMVCPALIFSIFNVETQFEHGWGIPMATDIAFSLGVLSLLGKRIPIQLKIFLAALAIIDDLGAIITIAIFYTNNIQFYYLICSFGTTGILILLSFYKIKNPLLYIIPGIILWYCLFNSGVHPTISGVIVAFTMPLTNLEKLEKILHFPVNFLIMPLFALANTAIILPHEVGNTFTSSISLGVMLGLIVGKPVGIFLFSFFATKMGIASLPSGTNYKQIFGIGMLGGIGFTMSIFTSTLAYDIESLQIVSKVCVICSSIVSSLIGFVFLKNLHPVMEITPVKKKSARFIPIPSTDLAM